MNILAVDTSTDALSIGLKTDSDYEERLIKGSFAHAEDLLGEIKALLARHRLKLKDLNLLICAKGPGSFTGLRVGMATMKGFSTALNIPLVSIGTLEAIEKTIADLTSYPVLAVIDAKKRRFYFQLKKNDEVIIEPRDGNAEDIVEVLRTLGTVVVTGPDAVLFAQKLLDADPSLSLIIDKEPLRNLSASLILLGVDKFNSVGPDDIGEGPLYIRRSDAEEALLKRLEEQ